MATGGVTEVVGVYDADGGPLGELAYVWGKVRGTAHCSLCDITHGRVRRRRDWDAMVAGLEVAVDLRHRNELTPEQQVAARDSGLPVVLGREAGGEYAVLLDAAELDALGGDVDAFRRALSQRLTLS